MNIMFLVPAQAQAASPAGGMGSFLIMMVLVFAVMYFLMIRPQQKKQKELARFRDSLQKGDKVVTVGGIYGTVSEVKEKVVHLEVDNNVRIKVDKGSLVKDITDVPVK